MSFSTHHINYDVNTLTRHTMVVGTTGSGKTNTVFHLLRQLASCGIPFLVIEPAKTEYRALLESELGSYLRVFTLGKETLSPFRLNPFEILPGISVQTHIDHLKSVFNASFAMPAPMPYVLEQCIHEVYEDKGWDLITSENRRGFHPLAHPTLSDLYFKIDDVIERLGYEAKITMNIKAALKTRTNSLRIGGKGLMLDTHVSLPITTLLHAPTILELDSVGDDDEKAFLMGLVLMSIYEYYRATGHSENQSLKHITVIEEAHRLLKRTPPIADLETANMAGKAVESFSNILAEIRAYGEGMVVAEQIPSKLTLDIIKNTNLKIVHRTIAEDDRRLMGGAMNLELEQLRWLGSCSVGEAAVFGDGDDGSIQLKIPYRKVEMSTGGSSDDKITTIMSAFHAQNSECFNSYTWSPIDSRILQTYRNQAQKIVEHSEFQEVLARYVLSVIVVPQSLFAEFYSLVQIVHKQAGKVNVGELLKAVLTYGIDWFFEVRGQQVAASYAEIVELKQKFASILFQDVLPRYKQSTGEPQFPLSENLRAFQACYLQVFRCESYPFVGCQSVCPDGGCLDRYNAFSLSTEATLHRRFTNAIQNSPFDKLGESTSNVAKMAIRRSMLLRELVKF